MYTQLGKIESYLLVSVAGNIYSIENSKCIWSQFSTDKIVLGTGKDDFSATHTSLCHPGLRGLALTSLRKLGHPCIGIQSLSNMNIWYQNINPSIFPNNFISFNNCFFFQNSLGYSFKIYYKKNTLATIYNLTNLPVLLFDMTLGHYLQCRMQQFDHLPLKNLIFRDKAHFKSMV